MTAGGKFHSLLRRFYAADSQRATQQTTHFRDLEQVFPENLDVTIF